MPAPSLGIMFRREQSPASLPAYARRVEALGFDALWVVEDCFFAGGIAQATTALAATSRLRVGIGINPAVARNPAFLAMEYATLSALFPGRLIGGIGHGVAAWMDQIGITPPSWLAALDESVSAITRLLNGETVTTHGRTIHLTDVTLAYPPDPVPPILLGVRGEKSLARLRCLGTANR